MSLVNLTMGWLKETWADQVDFVLITGDSARHDRDDLLERTAPEVTESNALIAQKLYDTFGSIPVIPSLGNNDVYPKDIMKRNAGHFLKDYWSSWSEHLPKSQESLFLKPGGGYFAIEVVKNDLAVLSLNTNYLVSDNKAVKGCRGRSQVSSLIEYPLKTIY